MIFGVDKGHSIVPNGGAVGYKREVDQNRLVGNRLIAMLREKGHTVVDCTCDKASDSNAQLRAIMSVENKYTLDAFLSLHLNAYKMTTSEMGVETYSLATTGKGREYAVKIQNELVSRIGWKNRGVKTANYYVLKNSKAPAVLVELGFCDSKADMDKWDTEKICRALFKALTGVEYTSSQPTPPTNNGSNENKGDGYLMYIYQNGSTKETVYETSTCTKEIGCLSPYEKANCIGEVDGKAIVLYNTSNGKKVGFCKWLGGIKK